MVGLARAAWNAMMVMRANNSRREERHWRPPRGLALAPKRRLGAALAPQRAF
jgi:hypothetical protein